MVLHPLRKYPGPKLWAATRLIWIYHQFKGDLIFKLKALHDRYGPIVRIAPDELSFIDAAIAWKDIYGGTTTTQLNRDPHIFPPDLPGLEGGLINAGNEKHARMRKQLNYAFSQRALEQQVPLIQSHVNVLIRQLHRTAEQRQAFDLAEWMNFATFDIITHLAFGEKLGCLEKGQYHPYAAFLLDAFVGGIFASAFNRYGLLRLTAWLIPPDMARKRDEFIKMSLAFTEKRIAQKDTPGSERPDFLSYILGADEEDRTLAFADLAVTSVIFTVAGSESTATLITGTIWFLLQSHDRMRRVTDEIRCAFETDADINLVAISKLPYLLACLEEGMRMATPAPFGVARRTTKPTLIGGHTIPKNTSVSVPQYAAWHNESNFAKANEFIPERWLDESSAGDMTKGKAGFFPFSTGPRSCIGKK